MLRRIAATSSSWAMLPVRLALGAVFIAHGAGKVLGSWGGPGLRAFSAFPPPYAFMRPGWLWMGAAALSELIGGILVTLGLLTRVGAFFLMCVILTAMFGVHWKNGFFLNATAPGIEYTVALLGMSLALLIGGAGQVSVDRMLGGRRR